MKKLMILSVALVGALFTTSSANAQQIIADWTFETSQPATAGSFSPESGSGAATGHHANTSTYSSPAGNGSSHSFSSNTWSVGDYYQFQVSTTGLDDIKLTFDQTSSSTGPEQFQLEYSLNGTNFTNIGSAYTVLGNGTSPNAAWNGTTSSSAYTFSDDLSSIAALDNASTIYLRLADASSVAINGGSVATTGTDRVDNVVISGTAVETPEPSTYALGAVALGALVLARRFRLTATRRA